jgi:hypothetical protein
MAERLKAPVLKTGEGATLSWVRIPLHPPPYSPLSISKNESIRSTSKLFSVNPDMLAKQYATKMAKIQNFRLFINYLPEYNHYY